MSLCVFRLCVFFFNDTATTEIYTYLHTLSLHDALPISLNNGDMQLREILDLEAMLTKDPAPESLEDEEEDDGEISEKNAGVSFKDEEDRKSTRLNSSH